MIKLRDILLEDDKPFGNVLFGDPNDPEELRDLQNANEPEPDTSLEAAMYNALERWYKESYAGFTSYAKKLMSMKKDYPTILDPMQYDPTPIMMYRVGKLSIHLHDILSHLNANASKVVIKENPMIGIAGDIYKSYVVSLESNYTYKIEGKDVTSWGVDNPQVLKRTFAYGNQVLYGAPIKANSSKCVMNPAASTAISSAVGNVHDEAEVIYVGNLITTTYIEIPMFISDGLSGYFTFGDSTNIGLEYNAINTLVDDRYKSLVKVLAKRIQADGFWEHWDYIFGKQ